MKIVWIIIDMQNDFCRPDGALYVPGAEKDAERISGLLRSQAAGITDIWLTRDEHQVLDIAHPAFWKDREGKMALPFTRISAREVEEGKWSPFAAKPEVLDYLRQVEASGMLYTVWPEHCIQGSEGAAIFPGVMEAVKYWSRTGKFFRVLTKGTYPLTEHYGAFQAEVPREDVPETLFHQSWVEELYRYDQIWIAGEAQSHCVAQTVRQLSVFPGLIRKLVILKDCMSPVAGCSGWAAPVFYDAVKKGACFGSAAAWMRAAGRRDFPAV